MKARGILRCSDCDKLVSDVDGAMYVWLAHADRVVQSAGLVHKRCDGGDPAVQSLELAWFADAGEALQRVAELASSYNFTSNQLRELITIAWAVAFTASPEQAEGARKVAERLRGG